MSQGISNHDIYYVEPKIFGPRRVRVQSLVPEIQSNVDPDLCRHVALLGHSELIDLVMPYDIVDHVRQRLRK